MPQAVLLLVSMICGDFEGRRAINSSDYDGLIGPIKGGRSSDREGKT